MYLVEVKHCQNPKQVKSSFSLTSLQNENPENYCWHRPRKEGKTVGLCMLDLPKPVEKLRIFFQSKSLKAEDNLLCLF